MDCRSCFKQISFGLVCFFVLLLVSLPIRKWKNEMRVRFLESFAVLTEAKDTLQFHLKWLMSEANGDEKAEDLREEKFELELSDEL
jgi:hypothetical protein